MKRRPILSIGMIFKNEIRCLERCMESLVPLRKAIPCELVMADTGSDDGSREIAEKFADILFDFPWINDFSAARNAVMDRCSGEWYLTVDADEWLDDCTELEEKLRTGISDRFDACTVVQRNYTRKDVDSGYYSDFYALRMIRMSTGRRYSAPIHESWDLKGLHVLALPATVLRHDGYVAMNIAGDKEGKEKLKRNMELLRKRLEERPNSLTVLQQCIESSESSAEGFKYIRRALEVLRTADDSHSQSGANILFYAANRAKAAGLPELWDYIEQARERYPNSIRTRLYIAAIAADARIEEENYAEAISWLESCEAALEDYHAFRFDIKEMMYAPTGPSFIAENRVHILLANAYYKEGQYERSLETLRKADGSKLEFNQVTGYAGVLLNLQSESELELEECMAAFWEQIGSGKKEHADRRKQVLMEIGAKTFQVKYREKEDEDGRARHVYQLFLSLSGKCDLGTAAQILESDSPEEIARLLATVEKWNVFPAAALLHGLERGVMFPLPERPLKLEEMDALTARLAEEMEGSQALLLDYIAEDFAGSWQTLAWARGLALVAVRKCKWEDEADMELARAFAKTEQAYITACYSPEVLREGNVCVLPSMHRFAWYCAQAFAALDAGDTVGYVRHLREGLGSAENMKPMVEFLTENTPELQAPPPDPELLELAEKVRTMLAVYPADDPAVVALKASPAYQRVARFIEEDER